jgi:asparagine synthase (glutamine-hydrolysing)
MNVLEFFSSKENIISLKKSIPEKSSIRELSKSLDSAVKEDCLGVKKCAVLFSGGLDSSLIAKSLMPHVPEIALFCSGLPNSNALTASKESAELLGLPLKQVIIQESEIPNASKEVSNIIFSDEKLQLQIALPEFFALREIRKQGFSHVFSGQGADELFCGYAEFSSVLEKKGYLAAEALCWEKLLGMRERNLERDFALALHFSLSLHSPFLHPVFMKQAMSFPAEEKILSPQDPLRKHVLRNLARYEGLPEQICSKKKKAIQYDSGITRGL